MLESGCVLTIIMSVINVKLVTGCILFHSFKAQLSFQEFFSLNTKEGMMWI